MQTSRVLVLLFIAISVPSTFADVPECYHAWNERIADKTCSTAADCGDPNADCIFSVTNKEHICCRIKAGATMPSCPKGLTMFTLGKNTGIVCANEDQCPEGFKCTESATAFDKLPGQQNRVCCK